MRIFALDPKLLAEDSDTGSDFSDVGDMINEPIGATRKFSMGIWKVIYQ